MDYCEGTSLKPLTSSENIAESHPLEVGSCNPTSDEPKCDSPIIISCSERSQSKKDYQEGGNSGLSHQNSPISNDHAQIPTDIHTHANDVKSTIEDDRSFTFVVGSLADQSDRENDKGWKPFSSVQPSALSQVFCYLFAVLS